jgi:membrane-bound lytic murein transglycosylase B
VKKKYSMKIKRKLFLIFLLAMMATAGFFNFSSLPVRADDAEELQDDLEKYEKKEAALLKELTTLESQSTKNQSKISATQKLIQTLQADIAKKEAELKSLQEKAEINKTMLGEYLRQIYYTDLEDSAVSLAISEGNLNDLMADFDRMSEIKNKIENALQIIEDAKTKAEKAKETLADKKQDNQEALQTQKSQQAEILGDIKETQLSLEQVKKKMSKIRSTLSSFLGSSYDLSDVVDAVKLADKKTGVRKEFIFAMLDKETDLGRYTGGCYYNKGSNAVKKHMKSADKSAFVELMDELGYGENEKKLSCWPGYGYGGAMGVAQFMPSTWNGYKSKIGDLTDNDPANPWRLEDGVMGMALKLKAAGASSKSKEHYAAKVYYCGGPSSQYWNNKCEAYADTVISWSKGYDEYFK